MMNSKRSRQAVKRVVQAGRLSVYTIRDGVRFWRHASLSSYDTGYEQLVARIMYNVHALEKGLAHVRAWAPGRGRKAIRNLNDAMTQYRRQGYDETSYSYIEGVSILQRYNENHRERGYALPDLAAIIDPEILTPTTTDQYIAAGIKTVHRPNAETNSRKGFYELSQGRVSVREFSGHPIDQQAVLRAIANAGKTPSVCNRQGWRTYKTENKELMREVLKHQRGFAYEQMPETLLAVTVSNSSFISPVERNQGFVDGGLYSMSVLYGLEAEGLGAVPLNACLYMRDRSAVVRLLDIDPSEEIIMFIAVGDYPEVTVVPMSDRRPTETMLRPRR
ncbi:nitroreductase family protein [Microbacterium sp. A204]|uniref:nitroreductase family protein n=1 Tax=Microbacterium sp. A204 TaxID=3457321 RepID=UPI003FD16725